MKYDYKEIKRLPDTFSLEDLRVVCHISKRTARFYLQTGLIACHNNGKNFAFIDFHNYFLLIPCSNFICGSKRHLIFNLCGR